MFIFREIMVEDRKLAEFLRAVAGLVAQMAPPQPVVNIEQASGGKRMQFRQSTNGSAVELFRNYLHQRHTKEFDAKYAKEAARGIGMSPVSYNYLLKQALKGGLIKKRGKGHEMKYEVIG